MAADTYLQTLVAERDEIIASIREIESQNTERADFEGWTLNRVRLNDLTKRLYELNIVIQERRARLQGKSFVFGSYVERVKRYDD